MYERSHEHGGRNRRPDSKLEQEFSRDFLLNRDRRCDSNKQENEAYPTACR